MDVQQDSPSTTSTTPLRESLTSATRAVDVANLALDFDPSEPLALVVALTRAWDAGAAASEAEHSPGTDRRNNRRPEFIL